MSNGLLTTFTDVLGRTTSYAYNPAAQITSMGRDNDAYAYTGLANQNQGYTVNGLNQYTTVGAATPSYDANGNLTSDGTKSYGYDAENRMVSASTGAALTYDPLGRLWQVTGSGGTTQFLYDGDQLTSEYDGGGNLLRRYVHGTGEDDPQLWYEGAGLGDRRSLQSDHEGSIDSVADAGGNALAVNSYDEYGKPASANQGKFQYTGQAWLPEVGLYYYKARMYDPATGRFLQTDPVGYKDQVNLYAYVANDPVNGTDPSGEDADDIVVTGTRAHDTPCLFCFHLMTPPPGFVSFVQNIRFNPMHPIQNFKNNVCGLTGALCNKAVDLTDTESVKGKTPEEVEEAAKEAGYTDEQPTTGEGGKRLVRPSSGGRQIRIMPGNPADPNPVKQGPYVRIPLDGPGGTRNSPPIPLKGNGAL